MKKAMLGSITDYVIQRVACPCLVVKPKVRLGAVRGVAFEGGGLAGPRCSAE
jgi:hypothetical protein